MTSYRIGIDVGGTHTDAVLLDNDYRVMAETKAPTSADVSSGIYQALHDVVTASRVPVEDINFAMLGTTHCTNAIVERKRLNDVAIIRIGAPATMAVKPLLAVPDDLKELLGKYTYIVHGGNEFDGREIADLDEDALYRSAREIKGKVDSVAITSIFSPVSNEHEQRAAAIMQEVLGENTAVSLSSEIGNVGLLDRENATILNAAVVDVAKTTAQGFIRALEEENIDAAVFFGQNDGTLMSVDYTIRYPILTIACGPTNSLRGAAYLSDQSDALVIDVGGTTTDIGVLSQSFPRQSSLAVEIGGVRTNFRMPDIMSVGLGGGTVIHVLADQSFQIGPDSVGHLLSEKALIFGGDCLTATDVVVGLGKASIGDPQKVAHLDQTLLGKIYAEMVQMIEVALDKMKTSADPVSVILVGGGSMLLPNTLQGASDVICPNHSGVANAIGSAISQVSGEIEKIFKMDKLGRSETIERAKQLARDEAIAAGADPDDLVMVDLEDIPLAYLPGDATRIRAKAAGSLKQIDGEK